MLVVLIRKAPKLEKHCELLHLRDNLIKYKATLAGFGSGFQQKSHPTRELSFLNDVDLELGELDVQE